MGVKGYREWCAEVDRIVADVGKTEWLYEACEFVRREASNRAPMRTGALKSSIDYEVRSSDKNITEGVIFTDLPYATFVEFGTGPVGRDNHDGISPNVNAQWSDEPWVTTLNGISFLNFGQPAQPFLYPALADNIDKVMDIARVGLDEALKG